jgi:hypothetical protein
MLVNSSLSDPCSNGNGYLKAGNEYNAVWSIAVSPRFVLSGGTHPRQIKVSHEKSGNCLSGRTLVLRVGRWSAFTLTRRL